jgi:hypothetical protein
VALTGRAVGFGVFESLEVLGKAESLARLRQSIARIPSVRNAQSI